MALDIIPVRCWVEPDGTVHKLPLLDSVDVYSRWASTNRKELPEALSSTEDNALSLSLIKVGWLMVHWQRFTCGEGFEGNAIDLAHSWGFAGKWYTINVLKEDGSNRVGSVMAGNLEKKPVWWE